MTMYIELESDNNIVDVKKSGETLRVHGRLLAPGTYIDRSGKEVTLTPESIQEIYQNLEGNAVPIALTHDDDKFPIVGFATNYYLSNDNNIYWVGYIFDRMGRDAFKKHGFDKFSAKINLMTENSDIEHIALVPNPAIGSAQTISVESVQLQEYDGKQYKEQFKEMGDVKEEEESVEFEKWDRAYINDLPDSSFAYVESCYGKTTNNKNARHLPYKDKNGKIDLPHLRNALARVNQIKPICPNTNKSSAIASARAKLQRAARNAGVGEYSESNGDNNMKVDIEKYELEADKASEVVTYLAEKEFNEEEITKVFDLFSQAIPRQVTDTSTSTDTGDLEAKIQQLESELSKRDAELEEFRKAVLETKMAELEKFGIKEPSKIIDGIPDYTAKINTIDQLITNLSSEENGTVNTETAELSEGSIDGMTERQIADMLGWDWLKEVKLEGDE